MAMTEKESGAWAAEKRGTVLIVDNDAALCRSLQIQLKILGYEAIVAFTASHGLLRAANFSPTLIFLGIHLPDESGLNIYPFFRSNNPHCRVILMASDISQAKLHRSKEVMCLPKPFELDDFLSLVGWHFSGLAS